MVENLPMMITFGVFIATLAFGLYIHSVLLGVGVIGLILIGDGDLLPGLLGYQPFSQVATYSLTTIPLFVIMAQFMMQAGIVDDMFKIVYNASKGKRGPLGALTLIIGAFLGAVSGSGVATAASLGQISVPQLEKHGYDKHLAGAVASAAGSLSGVIPPSIILILYGVITETSIGDLFIAAFIPGILVTAVFVGCVLFFLRKTAKEHVEHDFVPLEISRKRKIIDLTIGGSIIGVIFGGIYTGAMSPTEAGAAGAFVAFVGALLLGKVNKEFVIESITGTVKVSCMVMLIIIGAKIFGRCISLSMITRDFLELLEPLIGNPVLLLVIISLLFFALFMLMEGSAVIVMTLPILLPIIMAIGIDVVWFGVFLSVLCTVGLITPPVGLSVYAVCGVSKLEISKVFYYTTIMGAAVTFLVGGLLIAFPDIVRILM